jgi:hypothetical protein
VFIRRTLVKVCKYDLNVVFLAEIRLNVWVAMILALGRLGVVLCLITEGHVPGLGGLPNMHIGAEMIGT